MNFFLHVGSVHTNDTVLDRTGGEDSGKNTPKKNFRLLLEVEG